MDRQVALTIADLKVKVHMEGTFPLRMDGNLEKFIGDADDVRVADSELTIAVGEIEPRVAQEVIFESGSVWRLCRDAHGSWFELRSPLFGEQPYKVATFNEDFSRGSVVIRPDVVQAFDGSYPLEYPLDELLWIHLLSAGRGIEVHGCGIVDDDGVGRLFVGASGAGKSTTAQLWSRSRSVTILSDDRVILRPDGDDIWMHGTPWHGDAAFGSPVKAKLAELYFLRHGESNKVAPLSRSLVVSRLMATSFLPFHSAPRMLSSLGFCELVSQAVAGRLLDFVPDPSAVDFVSTLSA